MNNSLKSTSLIYGSSVANGVSSLAVPLLLLALVTALYSEATTLRQIEWKVL